MASPTLFSNDLPMHSAVQWISSKDKHWDTGDALLSSDGVLSLSNARGTVRISDVRYARAVGNPQKKYIELIIRPAQDGYTHLIIATPTEASFIVWLAGLLLWTNVRPAGLTRKTYMPPVVVPTLAQSEASPARDSGESSRQSSAQSAPGDDNDLLVCQFQVYFPFARKGRRVSVAKGANTAATAFEDRWQQVVGVLQRDGTLQLARASDGVLLLSLDVKTVLSSRVRSIDESLFEHPRVIYVKTTGCAVTTRDPVPRRRGDLGTESPESETSSTNVAAAAASEDLSFYARFASDVDYDDWLASLRAFTRQRIFARSTRSLSEALRITRRVNVRILEAKYDLKNMRAGTQEPDFVGAYAEVFFEGATWARTFVSTSPDAPFWREDFAFDNFPVAIPAMTLLLKRRIGARISPATDEVLGSVTISDQQLQDAPDVEKWLPIDVSLPSLKDARIGAAICVRVSYDEVPILSADHYSPMRDLLLTHPDRHALTVHISETTGDIGNLSDICLRIYQTEGKVMDWLFSLIEHEVANVAAALASAGTDHQAGSAARRHIDNTLFRGNSLLTKSLERYMNMVGFLYLDAVVGMFARKVVENEAFLEIDPARLAQHCPDTEDLERVKAENQTKLAQYASFLWSLVVKSTDYMPVSFKLIFRKLRQELEKRMPDSQHIVYNTISGFLFLRFFSPALLNPKLFGLIRAHPTAKVQRSLTLIAKLLQGFANRVRFGLKEPWMIPMNEFIESHEDGLVAFFKSVSLVDHDDDVAVVGTEDRIAKEDAVASPMGCNLSNPFLIDKYEAYARLVGLWNANKARPSLDGAMKNLALDKNGTPPDAKAENASPDQTSRTSDRSAIAAFAAECDRLETTLATVRDRLERAETVEDFDRADLIKASPLKLVPATGQVCLASTQLSTTPIPRSSSAENGDQDAFEASASLVSPSPAPTATSSTESVSDPAKLHRSDSRSRKNKWGRMSTIRKIM